MDNLIFQTPFPWKNEFKVCQFFLNIVEFVSIHFFFFFSKIRGDRESTNRRIRQNSYSRPLSAINDLFDSRDFLFQEINQDEVRVKIFLDFFSITNWFT